MRLIDLTHPLIHGQQTFPTDPKLSIIAHGTIATLKYNISQISMGTHQGTHLDAMFHFIEDGKTIDQMPLDWFYGPAHVLRIPKQPREELTVADFEPFEHLLTPGARIIYETGWHREFGQPHFRRLHLRAQQLTFRKQIFDVETQFVIRDPVGIRQ